jgi:ribA/ribD-fused uncharacterized protein
VTTVPPRLVDSFTGEHAFLSNFSPHPVHHAGLEWPTAEHAYQAAKTADSNLRARILGALTPGAAKRLGRRAVLPPQWETRRIFVMRYILLAKFSRAKPTELTELTELLLGTGYSPLVEGNTWHDNFWGDCRCWQNLSAVDQAQANPTCAVTGENWLGRLLEVVREDLRGGSWGG